MIGTLVMISCCNVNISMIKYWVKTSCSMSEDSKLVKPQQVTSIKMEIIVLPYWGIHHKKKIIKKKKFSH